MAVTKPWNVPHLAAGAQKPTIDPDQIVVYNMRFCPYAERTILVLLAKNLPFTVVNLNLKKKPEWFVEETFGKVSVVLYKDNIIVESNINCDFLDEEFPAVRLHPLDPAQKAKDRIVVEISTRMNGPYYKCLTNKGPENEEIRAKSFKELCVVINQMNTDLKKRGSKFFGGEQPGMLDYMMWPWFERFPVLTIMYPNLVYPAQDTLDTWQADMWNTGPVNQYGLTPEVHVQFFGEYKDAECNFDILLNKE